MADMQHWLEVSEVRGQMNMFSEKVRTKKILDAQILDSASKSVYHSLGKTKNLYSNKQMQLPIGREIQRICDFFKISAPEFSKELSDAETIMQYVMCETGMMRRKIVLADAWWKDGATPLICSDQEGKPYALLPASNGGYVYYEENTLVKVTENTAKKFDSVCYCFYQPIENRALTTKEFLIFLCKSFGATDVIWLLAISFLAGLVGMIMPALNQFIFNSVVPSGTSKEIFGISVLIVGTVFVQGFCVLARSLWIMRIGNKMELLAQNSIWARVLSLPIRFFKEYSSGELSQRVASIDEICRILGGQLLPTLLGSIFSFMYLFQISSISSTMFMPSLLIIVFILMINIVAAVMQIKQNAHNNKIESKLSGIVFQLLGGITKIKVAGAEARAFGKWAEIYSSLKILPSKILILFSAISGAINFGGTIVLYYIAYHSGMSASEYIAFNTAFSLFTVAIMSLTDVTSQIASLKPSIDMLKPILEATPENSGYKKQVASLSGDIEINQVKFRYNEDMPYVLDGLKLHIKKGEYVGIVGSSGCGKSTLIRVLLGFEKPQSGSVYYDMQDMEGIDLRSLRRRIGVVLQNGKLFSGDIYSNIVISAPWLTVDDAWKAAEQAGFAEDIRKMPMGMFTMLSEDGGGLSGGQQQRLMIARALVASPDILMFDEATSALDNITQSLVVKTLEELQCTRIVIAHRLSTIKNCSRIIYLDKGRVVEAGTYEELMQLGGKFAEMAKRQIV